jgi:ABC-type transport system substrate-binding protein
LKERQTAAGVNKTILSNVKFRQALSWALDRKTFVQTETAGSTPALGVINDMYVADEATGTLYRDTDAGKRVITDIYGDSKDGFNLAKAKQLITEACTEEAASTKDGHYTTGDKVSLEFVVYNDDWKTAIQNHIDDFVAATVGTPLEGKFEVTMTVTEKNQEAITAGNAELCMDIWGGAQMNPYGIPDTWIKADNRTCYRLQPGCRNHRNRRQRRWQDLYGRKTHQHRVV